MNKRPIIGISGSHHVTDHQFFIRENYMESVLRAGGMPVLLPEIADIKTAEAMLDSIDALLLAGGGDVEPSLYGRERIAACGEADAMRDTFEWLLIPRAIKRGMPIFGICRGIQVLSAALGGTLIQDIETQKGIPAVVHQQEPPYNRSTHEVRFTEDGLLSRIIGATTMQANSMHHQAIEETGPRLRVEGLSDDGIIEAVSLIGNENVFAVQFHPEYLAAESEPAAKLFAYFVECARAYCRG